MNKHWLFIFLNSTSTTDILLSQTERNMRYFIDLYPVDEALHFILQAKPLELDSD